MSYYLLSHSLSLSPSIFFNHHSPFLCNTQQANLGWSQWTARQNRQAYPWAARGASVARSADGFLTFPLRFPSASGFVALHTIIFVLLTNILLYYNNNIILKKNNRLFLNDHVIGTQYEPCTVNTTEPK